jgi:hypothetical protein
VGLIYEAYFFVINYVVDDSEKITPPENCFRHYVLTTGTAHSNSDTDILPTNSNFLSGSLTFQSLVVT